MIFPRTVSQRALSTVHEARSEIFNAGLTNYVQAEQTPTQNRFSPIEESDRLEPELGSSSVRDGAPIATSHSPESLAEDSITCSSGFTSPAVSLDPSAPSGLSVFRPWQAGTSTFADEFIMRSTATQDPAATTSVPVLPIVSVATPIVSRISTSSPKEATKTDAKPIVEEEDLMPQLLGNNGESLDSDQETRRKEDSERPYLAQMVEIIQEGNRRVQQELERNSRALRCFEKTIEKAINSQTDSLNQLNNTIGNLASFLRVHAREERHQKEAEETRKRKDKENKHPFRCENPNKKRRN